MARGRVRIVFSAKQIRDITKMFSKDRLSTVLIGRKYGVTCNTIINLLRETGTEVCLSDRRTKQFTQAARRRIVKLYDSGNGKTAKYIGAEYECSHATINRVLKEENVYKPRTEPSNKIKFTDAQEADILTQYAEGASANALSKAFGCGGSAMLGFLRRKGIDTTDYGRGKPTKVKDRGLYKTGRRLSHIMYRRHRNQVNPKGLKRTIAGHHMDHMISLSAGIIQGLTIMDLAHPCNLQILPARENLSKHADSSITKRELLDSIKIWNKAHGDPYASIVLGVKYPYRYGRYRYVDDPKRDMTCEQ